MAQLNTWKKYTVYKVEGQIIDIKDARDSGTTPVIRIGSVLYLSSILMYLSPTILK